MEDSVIARLLFATAWPMETAAPYSFFHLALAAFGTCFAVACAVYLAGRPGIRPARLTFACGLILAACECYKQAFLYVVVYQYHYNWWYFPFQLCSIPMYLCLAYPFLGKAPGIQGIISTFLQDFGFLGGIMALAVPDGLLHPYKTLTLHGFFWHFLLIFLGIYCCRKRLSEPGVRGFFRMLPLYFFCCITACAVNTAVQLIFYPESYTDLFYINCFFPSEQPVFGRISLAFGNVWGHIAYILASCFGAFLIHLVGGMLRQRTAIHKKEN